MQLGSQKRGSTDGDVSPPPSKRRAPANSTNKAVANFFKPLSEKEPEKVKFSILHETLLVGRHENAVTLKRTRPVKIAAFDFDDTLIATKSGLKFARGEDDWRWWHPTVPSRLKKLDAEGYTIVVISNQGGISLRSDAKTPKDGMRSLNNMKGKVTAALSTLDLPISVYAATGPDIFRKPRTGIWEQILKDYNLNDTGDIDHESCFFVGDAAGRAGDKKAGIKKDHSCCDRDFAANVNIQFHTPEEFFSQAKSQPFQRGFDPSTFLSSETASGVVDPSIPPLIKTDQTDMIIFCGSPGAGKSTFYWRHLQPLGYERVNQDTLKTRDKCMKVAAQHLSEGRSVAVDNTNAEIETRAVWISLARKHHIPIRLVHFTASTQVCEHNDTVRALAGSSTVCTLYFPWSAHGTLSCLGETSADGDVVAESRKEVDVTQSGIHQLCITLSRAEEE